MLGTCKTVSHGGATMAAALGVARLMHPRPAMRRSRRWTVHRARRLV